MANKKNNNPAAPSPLLFICDYAAFTFGARVLHLNHFGQCCHNNRLKWDCLSWEKAAAQYQEQEGSSRAEMSTLGSTGWKSMFAHNECA